MSTIFPWIISVSVIMGLILIALIIDYITKKK
jgi:hypothetical protein